MKKIKVLRIINRFNIGGPTYNATFLTRFLSDDFETRLVGGLPEEGEADSLHIPAAYGVSPEIIVEMHRTPNLKSDYATYKKLKEIIQTYQPDIVHTHAAKAGALGRLAAAQCGVPVIVHTYHGHVFHSYFGTLKTTIFKIIERYLARKSTGIIAISPLQKQELSEIHRICPANKIQVVPMGFDLDRFHTNLDEKRTRTRNTYGLTPDTVAVAIVGRLAPIKNHAFFLEVVAELLHRGTQNVRFFIVGDGELHEEIATRVNELNQQFGSFIEMTSWIKDIASFNAGMDVICLTSNNEGTPVSLIEAQAANLPVVTTDVGGVKDIILEGETGFVIPLGNKSLYADKLELLINDKEKREKMSQNGWNFVKESFSYHRLVRDIESYYRTLLEEKRKK